MNEYCALLEALLTERAVVDDDDGTASGPVSGVDVGRTPSGLDTSVVDETSDIACGADDGADTAHTTSAKMTSFFACFSLRTSSPPVGLPFLFGPPAWALSSVAVKPTAAPLALAPLPATGSFEAWPPLTTPSSTRWGWSRRRAMRVRATGAIRKAGTTPPWNSDADAHVFELPRPRIAVEQLLGSPADSAPPTEAATLMAGAMPDMRGLLRPFVAAGV